MDELRRLRRFGRLLAAWLLLWFVAMAAAPGAQGDAWSSASTAGGPGDEAICTQAADASSPGHAADAGHGPASGRGDGSADFHAGHASGALSHCPLCLHAAAPPPVLFATAATGEPPSGPRGARRRAQVAVRTDAPAPARGPPVFS